MANKPGRPKKTTTIVATKKTFTKAQIATLREIENGITDIRRKLYQMEEDSETMSKIMFNVGMLFKTADDLENKMCDFLEEIDEEAYRINF